MAGTNQTLNPNMSAKHSSDRYIPQCVRSVSLYQRKVEEHSEAEICRHHHGNHLQAGPVGWGDKVFEQREGNTSQPER